MAGHAAEDPPTTSLHASWRSRLIFVLLFGLIAASTNQLDYAADHQQIVVGAGDILSYYAMSRAAPGLVEQPVPYHHAQRIVLPYGLGLVSRVSGQMVQTVYLCAGTVLLFLAFWFFLRCCEILALTEATLFLVGGIVLFNPYLFRHLIMFNGYINDIGFLTGMSICLYGALTRRRRVLLAGIVFSAFSRQTTLLTIPAWLLLEYSCSTPRKLRLDWLTASYVALPVLVYVATSAIATKTGLPSETNLALLGIFYWFESSFSVGRLASFVIRGLIPFAFVAACWWGLRRQAAPAGDQRLTLYALWLLAASICIQPFLGGPDWTTNSIARLNALAVFPAALAVGILVNGAADRCGVSVWGGLGALMALGSIHHIYTFNGAFSADKNVWFAAFHFLAALTTAMVLRFGGFDRRDPTGAAHSARRMVEPRHRSHYDRDGDGADPSWKPKS